MQLVSMVVELVSISKKDKVLVKINGLYFSKVVEFALEPLLKKLSNLVIIEHLHHLDHQNSDLKNGKVGLSYRILKRKIPITITGIKFISFIVTVFYTKVLDKILGNTKENTMFTLKGILLLKLYLII